MNHFKAINLLQLHHKVFHVPILWTVLYYSHFCLCLSTRRLLWKLSKHNLLSQSLSQHFWKQPLANVLTSTQTARLRSTRTTITVCHQLPSKQKHITDHTTSSNHDNFQSRWWKLFVATCWPWSLSHTPDLAGQHHFSPKVFTLLSAQRQCPSCILPLVRDRVDKGSNATPTVAMSHFHHGTITVIHNRNHVWCWVCQT